MFGSKTIWAAVGCGTILAIAGQAQTAPRQTLPHHVPPGVRESRRLGPLSKDARVDLAIGLPLRNASELDSLIADIADPASPSFRQYLSSSEFTERFGPAQEDYDQLIAFVQANGLEVTATHPNRMILDVAGTVGAVERVLHVNLVAWSHATRGQFFAPDRDPWLDVDVAVLDITGLDNFTRPKPMDVRSVPLSSFTPLTTGSGPAGLFIGKDFRAAYAPGVSRTGAGQSIGLFELDGFYAGDVQANFKQAGLPAAPVQTVLLDGYNGAPGSGNVEVILDIMMAAYMAPGANIIVYEGYNWNDVLNRMATDNIAKQLSSSWAFSPINATTEQIFKQMIAQGQSLLQASGDSGAYSGWIMPPSDDPNVTVVGGTALTTTGPGGAWLSESTWNGSGGGVSTTYAIPSYQQNMNLSAIGGSNSMRNIPDVALTAAVQMYLICNNGQAIAVGGTSAAAPLWAGFVALANEQAVANGKPPAGFLNPALYTLGAGSAYKTALHDITSGSNGFAAIGGFDLATGWGTPAGQPLIDALSSMPAAPSFKLSATPVAVSVQTGASATATIQVTGQNGFSGSVALSVTGLPTGVTGTFSAVSANGASTLTLTASASAAAGNASLTVTGKSGTLSATVPITLTVSTPPGFSLSSSVSSLSVVQASSAAATITVMPKAGFTGKVNLAASGLPPGVTASFNPASTGTTSTVTFSATSSAALGAANVTVTGSAGTAAATVTIALTVKAPPGISVSAAPASLSLAQSTSGSTTITVTPINGFSGTAALSITGLPAGVTGTFSPTSTASTSKLTLAVASSAAIGTATASITAASGSISAKAALAVTITAAAGFKLSSTVSNVSVVAGGKGTAPISVVPQGGFTGTVTLSATGLPSGVTATFTTATAAASGTMTISVASTVTPKAYPFTINGTSGNLSASMPMTVTVMPLPDFSITLLPASLSIVAGGRGSTAVTLTPLNGFTGTVTLSISGMPAGVTASFGATTNAAMALATLSASSSAAAGATKVTVTATSGALSHAAVLSLTIVAPAAGTAIVDLSPAYNVSGSAIDNLPFTSGGLDALGRSYSGILLGASQTISGTVYSLGPMGLPDAVSGQTVNLPAGQFTTLKLLATGVNGNQTGQVFTVTYTDGTTSSLTQSLSDWYSPQNYSGETKAVTTTYRDNSTGTTDGRVFYLYNYSFSLNSAKTVKSVALPVNRNVVVMAMTLTGATNLVTAVQVDLSKAFNGIGITSDGKVFTGGLDGAGYAYSGSLLQGLKTFNGVPFQMGAADQPDVVSGTTNPLALPSGKYSKLLVLATGVNGAQLSQAFKITYTDGTSTALQQSLSDWFYPTLYAGEVTAVVMPYRNIYNGTKDNRPFELYEYTFTLNNTKTVSSVTLPAGGNVKVFAMTLQP